MYEVYGIFQNFFGEQFTDLQGIPEETTITDVVYACTDIGEIEPDTPFELSESALNLIKSRFNNTCSVIMVWWPRVTVTNENNRSVQIQDLYAKIEVTIDGRIPYEFCGFKLTRTTFPEIQFVSGYIHSHIPTTTGIPSFQRPCLGTGPINNTIMDLKNNYEETLWMLFCQELALYVTVESLRGGPYIRMENIRYRRNLYGFGGYSKIESLDQLNHFWRKSTKSHFLATLKDFITYYLENGHLSLNYKEGAFVVGMPYFDFMVDISNAFIDFYNKNEALTQEYTNRLFELVILVKALAADGRFFEYNTDTQNHDYSNVEGEHILTFKGESKTLHIDTGVRSHMEPTILLHHKIAMYILQNILRIINYRYRNEHNRNTGSSTESTASAYQTVIYI